MANFEFSKWKYLRFCYFWDWNIFFVGECYLQTLELLKVALWSKISLELFALLSLNENWLIYKLCYKQITVNSLLMYLFTRLTVYILRYLSRSVNDNTPRCLYSCYTIYDRGRSAVGPHGVMLRTSTSEWFLPTLKCLWCAYESYQFKNLHKNKFNEIIANAKTMPDFSLYWK